MNEAITITTNNDVEMNGLNKGILEAKRRRTEELRSISEGSPILCVLTQVTNDKNQLKVDRPCRAASSSPIRGGTSPDETGETIFQRNSTRMDSSTTNPFRSNRTSLGTEFRFRFSSPSDKRQPTNFYKEALKRDSAINRNQLMAGGWMKKSSSTTTMDSMVLAGKTRAENIPLFKTIKRKISNECMDTT